MGEGRLLGSGPWSESSCCAWCRIRSQTPAGSGLIPCDASMAAIRLIAAFLPPPLVSTGIMKSEANTQPFSLCRVSFQLLYLFLSCMALKCLGWALWGQQMIRTMFHSQTSPAVNCKIRVSVKSEARGAQTKYRYLIAQCQQD